MKILNVAVLACCVALLRTGWAASPLDSIERIVPGCRATVSKDARILAMTEFSFPQNTVVTVTRVDGNRGFFKVVQFGGATEASCFLDQMTRIYSEEEQKLLLEKRKLDLERSRMASQQAEWNNQRKEREAVQAAKQGRIEGTVTFSWTVKGTASNLEARTDMFGTIRGTVDIAPSRRPSSSVIAVQKRSAGGAGGRTQQMVRVAPDASGRFSLALEPGEYELTCIAENPPGKLGGNTAIQRILVEPDKTASCSFSF